VNKKVSIWIVKILILLYILYCGVNIKNSYYKKNAQLENILNDPALKEYDAKWTNSSKISEQDFNDLKDLVNGIKWHISNHVKGYYAEEAEDESNKWLLDKGLVKDPRGIEWYLFAESINSTLTEYKSSLMPKIRDEFQYGFYFKSKPAAIISGDHYLSSALSWLEVKIINIQKILDGTDYKAIEMPEKTAMKKHENKYINFLTPSDWKEEIINTNKDNEITMKVSSLSKYVQVNINLDALSQNYDLEDFIKDKIAFIESKSITKFYSPGIITSKYGLKFNLYNEEDAGDKFYDYSVLFTSKDKAVYEIEIFTSNLSEFDVTAFLDSITLK